MSFPVSAKELSDPDFKKKILKDTLITPKVKEGSKFDVPIKPFTLALIKDDVLHIPLYYYYSQFSDSLTSFESRDDTENGNWQYLPEIQNQTILRTNQIEIIDTAKSHLKQFNTTTLCVPPGEGKTIMAIYLATFLNFKTLIIVPSSLASIIPQWEKSIETSFELIDKSSILIVPEFAKSDKIIDDDKINFIISLDTRVKGIPKILLDKIGTVVYDEAHLLCTSGKVEALLLPTPKYIIALSATLEREDGADCMFKKLIAGPHSINKLSSKKFTVQVIRNPVKFQYQFNDTTGTMNYTEFCKDIANNQMCNQKIIDIVKSSEKERKFIILSKFIEHAKLLSKMLKEEGIATAVMAGKIKRHPDVKALVGTFPKISTGYDLATAAENFDGNPANTLILTHTIAKWQSFEQSKGRIMRESECELTPIVYWMATENKLTITHLEKISEHISKTNGKIIF